METASRSVDQTPSRPFPATLVLEMAKAPNIKPMTAQQRSERVVPARIDNAAARRDAVREASSSVRAASAIDFARSVRGR
jgi:hypothetical protein